MNELAGQSLGGYQLEEEIGRGSMGMVYRGKQIALGREVAIKVLPRELAKDASYVARFIREAQIIAGLHHPNIVQVLDFDEICAEEFGKLRGWLKHHGVQRNAVDLMIAAVARAHDLTLVTHNTQHFQHIPNLRLEDWLVP